MSTQRLAPKQEMFPIWTLVNPKRYTLMVLSVFGVALAIGVMGMIYFRWQTWQVTAGMLVVMFVAMIGKWRDDKREFGGAAMGLSILLMAQGFHMFEHLAQWFQYYVLNYTMQNSVGLLSPANSEWVHFAWNWSILLIIAGLIWAGVRNSWSWALLLYAIAHTTDHTYLFFRYLDMTQKLKALCGKPVSAQGLPGIIGQGGWLAQSDLTRGTFISRIPILTTAIRLDVHFYWNMGETLLLLLAAHFFLKQLIEQLNRNKQELSENN